MRALFAVAVNNQLTINGMPNAIAAYFLPIFSANIPAGRDPINAPMAKNEAIQLPEMIKKELIENYV